MLTNKQKNKLTDEPLEKNRDSFKFQYFPFPLFALEDYLIYLNFNFFFFSFFFHFRILLIFLIQQFLLVIHFIHISVYMSIPISQIIPPSPPHRGFPPLVSIRLFSTSVSQLLPCKQVHLYHFSRFHIHALIYDICFSLSDLLHSV